MFLVLKGSLQEISFHIEKMRSEIVQFPETIGPKKIKALAILEQALRKTRQEEDENLMSEAMLSYLGESEPLRPLIGQLKKQATPNEIPWLRL